MSNLNELKPVGSLNPFARFCCSIGNLPSSYMAALSYEEQLMWFCDYLKNTIIPAVNTNAEAVAELQSLYVTLKNYVDNYFNNLDVQEEINNKLDTMVTDGTLGRIINQEIFNNLNDEIDILNNQVSTINSKISDIDITSKNILLLSNYYKKVIRHSGTLNIGCMGDSITRGVDTVSDDKVQSTITTDSGYTQSTIVAGTTYPEKLQDLMQSLFTDFTTNVYNFGISGSTVKDAVTYWTQNKNCDLMLMMFGVNDGNENYSGDYYGDISQFIYYYEILIKRYLNFGSAIMLLTPTGGASNLEQGNFKYNNRTAYIQAVRMLGKKYNIPVIETTSEITNNFTATEFSESVHMNSKGYSLFASRLAAMLINANINEPMAYSTNWNSLDSAINVDNYSHITQTSGINDIISSYDKRQNVLANNTVVSLGIRTTEDNMVVSLNGYQLVGTLKLDDGLSSVPMFNGQAEIDINQNQYVSSSSTELRTSKQANINYLVQYGNYILIPNKGLHLITFKVSQANSTMAQFVLFHLRDVMCNNKVVVSLDSQGVARITRKLRNLFSFDRTGTNIFIAHILQPNVAQSSYIINTLGNVMDFASTATRTLTFNIDTSTGDWVFSCPTAPNATLVLKL